MQCYFEVIITYSSQQKQNKSLDAMPHKKQSGNVRASTVWSMTKALDYSPMFLWPIALGILIQTYNMCYIILIATL